MSINKSYSYTSSSITKRHLAERGGEIKDTVVLREASPYNSWSALFFLAWWVNWVLLSLSVKWRLQAKP